MKRLLEKNIPFTAWNKAFDDLDNLKLFDIYSKIAQSQLRIISPGKTADPQKTAPWLSVSFEETISVVGERKQHILEVFDKSQKTVRFPRLLFSLTLQSEPVKFETLRGLISRTSVYLETVDIIKTYLVDGEKLKFDVTQSAYLLLCIFFKLLSQYKNVRDFIAKVICLIDFSDLALHTSPRQTEVDNIVSRFVSSPLIQIAELSDFDFSVVSPYLRLISLPKKPNDSLVLFDPDLSRSAAVPANVLSSANLLRFTALNSLNHANINKGLLSGSQEKKNRNVQKAVDFFPKLLWTNLCNPFFQTEKTTNNSLISSTYLPPTTDQFDAPHLIALAATSPMLSATLSDWVLLNRLDQYPFAAKRSSTRRAPPTRGIQVLLGLDAHPETIQMYLFPHLATQTARKSSLNNVGDFDRHSQVESDVGSVIHNSPSAPNKVKPDAEACPLQELSSEEGVFSRQPVCTAEIQKELDFLWPQSVAPVGCMVAQGRSSLVTLAMRCNAQKPDCPWIELCKTIVNSHVDPSTPNRDGVSALSVFVEKGIGSLVNLVFLKMKERERAWGRVEGYKTGCQSTLAGDEMSSLKNQVQFLESKIGELNSLIVSQANMRSEEQNGFVFFEKCEAMMASINQPVTSKTSALPVCSPVSSPTRGALSPEMFCLIPMCPPANEENKEEKESLIEEEEDEEEVGSCKNLNDDMNIIEIQMNDDFANPESDNRRNIQDEPPKVLHFDDDRSSVSSSFQNVPSIRDDMSEIAYSQCSSHDTEKYETTSTLISESLQSYEIAHLPKKK
eukprot:GDKJ01029789.1.p1 GENE.GDKJ01029789.1~~GDKJ01029789.1.p1  ORF type:complete len:893 (+),score=213.61 GDKJ01029789.1:323-2680(+)